MTAGRTVELLLTANAALSVALAAIVDPVAGALVAGGAFVLVVAFVVYVLRQRASFDGPYRVLNSHWVWDLDEPEGQVAVVTKTVEVEFNHEVISLSDHAWGDGNQFAGYECDYGKPLEPRVRDGVAEYIVIALPAPRRRGERAKLISRRTVTDGFPESTEWVEYELRQKSERSTVELRFPAGRRPRSVRLRRRDDGPIEDVTDSLETVGRRQVFREEVKRTRRDDVLKLTWDW